MIRHWRNWVRAAGRHVTLEGNIFHYEKVMAGITLEDTSDLIGIVQQQAPGTWLPLSIEREGKTIDIVAKFPSAANGHGKP